MSEHRASPTGERRGRRVKPVVGYGPAAEHAHQLRQARNAAGDPSYKIMGDKVNIGHSTMSETASATRQLPSAENCRWFLASVAQDGTPPAAWCADHAAYARRAARFHPDLDRFRSRPALRAALRDALSADDVDDETLVERRADAEAHDVPEGLPQPVPSAAQLLADPCPDDVLLWRVYLGGGTPADVKLWEIRLGQLPPDPAPEPPLAPAAQPAPPARRGRRVSGRVLVGGVVVVVAALVGASLVRGNDDDGAETKAGQPGRGTTATSTSPPSINPLAGGPAAAELDTIIAAVEQSHDVTGATAHIDLVLTTYGPPPTYPRVVEEVTDELDWSPAAPGRRVVTGTGAPPTPEPLPPGAPTYAAGPPSADPAELQRVLERRRKPGGAVVLLLGVADLCESYPLTRAERLAVLRMLRAAPDLIYAGKVTVERLGVPGKAFSADAADGTREILVFDPGTGRLLSHESLLRRPDKTFVLTRRVIHTRSTWDDLPD
ncbi:hypothetical protein [Dactylosporangium sp. NPDC005555]|uniref:hypothetical protein n=1 Tax=Dactylosporangium sp. NPDC005555 TaxID=3154889 RepID=UPI0033B0E600